MKKTLKIAIALIIMSSLTACGPKEDAASKGGQSVESEISVETEQNSVNQEKNETKSGVREGETSDHVGKPGEKK